MLQARKALADRQKDLEVKTQQLEIKLSNKHEEDIKKARRKSTQAGQNQNRGSRLIRLWCFYRFLQLQMFNIELQLDDFISS